MAAWSFGAIIMRSQTKLETSVSKSENAFFSFCNFLKNSRLYHPKCTVVGRNLRHRDLGVGANARELHGSCVSGTTIVLLDRKCNR
jgi:hypothetical protein